MLFSKKGKKTLSSEESLVYICNVNFLDNPYIFCNHIKPQKLIGLFLKINAINSR